MPKIAVIFSGDLENPKGLVMSSISRAKYLSLIPGNDVDIFCISSYERWLARKL